MESSLVCAARASFGGELWDGKGDPAGKGLSANKVHNIKRPDSRINFEYLL